MLRWVILACVPACTWISDAELAARSDLDGDGVPGGEDCDDGDPAHSVAVDWYQDADGDGFGDVRAARAFCQPPQQGGWSSVGTDCDDTDAAIHPEAREVCNQVDDDCDGLANDFDPDLDLSSGVVVFPDGDGDGSAREAPAEAVSACLVPDGYALPPDLGAGEVWDCDDGNPNVFPGATEVCDDLTDNDCDTLVDEDGPGQEPYLRDEDLDGFPPAMAEVRELCGIEPGWVPAVPPPALDCDDGDGSVFPGAPEAWYDGVDQDCDGNDDDQDLDGVPVGSDCDDLDAGRSPLLAEVWYDGVDQDCDGNDDDQDFDGYPLAQDCDDTDPSVSPEQPEVWYDGVDQDCDGNDDDQDADGAPVATDCDDTDPGRSPLVAEIWYDGIDQDCSGGSDFDQDGDGYELPHGSGVSDPVPLPLAEEIDCNDGDPLVNPGADELCGNRVDDDCDGDTDDIGVGGAVQYRDADFDGFPADESASVCAPPLAGWVGVVPVAGSTLDCNDALATVRPDAAEIWYDGVDQNCDGNDGDRDFDGDPYTTDCDEDDPTVYRGAYEWCNDVDHDCDGVATPTVPSVTGIRQDGTLEDLTGLVGVVDGLDFRQINFCGPGPWSAEVAYDPGSDLVLRGYEGAQLRPKGDGLLAPSGLSSGSGARITLRDVALAGRADGVSSPAIVVSGITLSAEQVEVVGVDQTLFKVKSDGSLSLSDTQVDGGVLAGPLVTCSDCSLDVQGGSYGNLTTEAVFLVSGAGASASFQGVVAEAVNGSFLVVDGGAFAELVDVTVVGGAADHGPGVVVLGGGAVDIDRGVFDSNQATLGGGALYVSDSGSTLLARDTSFQSNDGGAAGGAVLVEADAGVQLIGCLGARNLADDGGALAVYDSFLFSDSSIWQGNEALVGDGGAMRVDDGTVVSASDRISSNVAGRRGGGAWVSGNSGVLSVTQGSFASNSAGAQAGGVGIGGRASLFLSDFTALNQNQASATGGGVWIESLGTFGSVDTLWSSNAPDDFGGVNYITNPGVIFCANGAPCLSF